MLIKYFSLMITLVWMTACWGADDVKNSGSSDFSYYEYYRATKAGTIIYVHGTLHTRKPESNPCVLNDAIHKAKAIFTENFHITSSSLEGSALTSLGDKIKRRDNEPNWFELFNEHPFKFEDKITTLYSYLEYTIDKNIKKMTSGHGLEVCLNSCSAFGIFALITAALSTETSDPNEGYDMKLFDEFKRQNKPAEFMETPHEICGNYNGLFPEEVTRILDSSDKPSSELLDLLCGVIVQAHQGVKELETAYKTGLGILARRSLPENSPFINGRTKLWVEKYFGPPPSQEVPNESLFCMGVGHIHPFTDDHFSIIQPGFLQLLEERGWCIDNLRVDGTWVSWSTKDFITTLHTKKDNKVVTTVSRYSLS